MLLCCSLAPFPAAETDLALQTIGELGVNMVEVVAPAPVEPTSISHSQTRADDWQRRLAPFGLRAATVFCDVGLAPTEANLRRQEAVLAFAQRLGAAAVVTTGDMADTLCDQAALWDACRRWADGAAERGLKILLTSISAFCADSRMMARVMRAIDHPAFRLEFDPSAFLSLNPTSSDEIALQRVLGWLGGARLCDYTGGSDNHFPPPGSGAVDFARMLEILRGMAFSGPCVMSFSPERGGKPADWRQRKTWLCDGMDHLRTCGWLDA